MFIDYEEFVFEGASKALGAKIVAKAWSDPSYKSLLLNDGAAGMAELGIDGTGQSAELVVVENSASQHNLVVW